MTRWITYWLDVGYWHFSTSRDIRVESAIGGKAGTPSYKCLPDNLDYASRKVSWRSGRDADDEGLKRRRQFIAGKIEAAHDFARDVFGDIGRPSFGGVEGDDAHRSVVLPRHQIGDRGFQIGALFAGLGIGAAIAAEIIEHEIDGWLLAVRHNRGYDATPATRATGFKHGMGFPPKTRPRNRRSEARAAARVHPPGRRHVRILPSLAAVSNRRLKSVSFLGRLRKLDPLCGKPHFVELADSLGRLIAASLGFLAKPIGIGLGHDTGMICQK